MSHFDWIHRESLRLGNMARDYHQQSVELLAEVLRLKADVDQLNAVVESHKDAGKRILAMLDEERRLTEHFKAEVERLKKDKPKTIEATYVVSAEDAKRIRARLDKMTENNETSPPTDGK